MTSSLLHDGLRASAADLGGQTAVIDTGGRRVSYGWLNGRSRAIARQLTAARTEPGDLIAVSMRQSADAIAVLAAILRRGAAYLPIDAEGPLRRTNAILTRSAPRLLVTDHPVFERLADGLPPAIPRLMLEPGMIEPDDEAVSLDEEPLGIPDTAAAYVLHTSGSTGDPKGVVVSHRAALKFVHWATATFRLALSDRVASIAPLSFDLSVFDIFASQWAGATVVLMGDGVGSNPRLLAERLVDQQVTVIYTTPSVLQALLRHGRIERFAFDHLRLVLFAGEVFPVAPLRELTRRWSHAAFHNLFGPTETNVCTWFPILRTHGLNELPIGRPCPHYLIRIAPDSADPKHGELLVSGEGLMSGYLNRPEETARVLHVDEGGRTWYHTGDVVSARADGQLLFHGRLDRMVKRNGHRIELGEIEASLQRHPSVEAAVAVAVRVGNITCAIHTFVVLRAECTQVELRRHCAVDLPAFMIPNRISVLRALPVTATGKIDLQALEREAMASEAL